MPSVSLRYRLAVLSRVLAAVFGGYALAALTARCIALFAPLPRADAVVTGMIVGFAVYVGTVIWAFAAPTTGRAWFGVLAPTLLLGAAAWLPRLASAMAS